MQYINLYSFTLRINVFTLYRSSKSNEPQRTTKILILQPLAYTLKYVWAPNVSEGVHVPFSIFTRIQMSTQSEIIYQGIFYLNRYVRLQLSLLLPLHLYHAAPNYQTSITNKYSIYIQLLPSLLSLFSRCVNFHPSIFISFYSSFMHYFYMYNSRKHKESTCLLSKSTCNNLLLQQYNSGAVVAVW